MLATLLVQTQIVFSQLLELHKLSHGLRFFSTGVIELLLPLDFKLSFIDAQFLLNYFVGAFPLSFYKLPIIRVQLVQLDISRCHGRHLRLYFGGFQIWPGLVK